MNSDDSHFYCGTTTGDIIEVCEPFFLNVGRIKCTFCIFSIKNLTCELAPKIVRNGGPTTIISDYVAYIKPTVL